MRFKPMRLKLIKIGCIVILVNVLSFNISFWTSSLSPHPGNGPFQYVVLQESATTVLYPLIMWSRLVLLCILSTEYFILKQYRVWQSELDGKICIGVVS